MSKVKDAFLSRASVVAEVLGISQAEAEDFSMDYDLGTPAELIVVEYAERLDYTDMPPEFGMATPEEDTDQDTQNVLKHIIGE